MRLKSVSKLNLCLHIVGRRPDGWHLLETVIDPIDWGDELRLRRRHDGRIIRRHGMGSVPPEQDLVLRAARLLQTQSACRFGADISLRKRVPHGAGLGGGSGDAALALVELNRLWRLHWPRERLARLALQLGADVPALLVPQPYFATGIGEQLQPICLPPRHYVVIFPGQPMATQNMYQDPDLERSAPGISARQFDPERHQHNSFQSLAERRQPQIRAALDYLRAMQCPNARLTGSGSAVFAECASREQARAVARACPAGWTARAVRSVRGR